MLRREAVPRDRRSPLARHPSHIPTDFRGNRLVLIFEAVKHTAKVWVNGTLVGGHEGGQTAFQLDVTDAVHPTGVNMLTVMAIDPAEGMSFFMDTHSLINISGIWRHVWLEGTGKTHVSYAFTIPDVDNGTVTLRIELSEIKSSIPMSWYSPIFTLLRSVTNFW